MNVGKLAFERSSERKVYNVHRILTKCFTTFVDLTAAYVALTLASGFSHTSYQSCFISHASSDWRLTAGVWRLISRSPAPIGMADGGWRMADGGWRMADGWYPFKRVRRNTRIVKMTPTNSADPASPLPH
jgi:hypothetical protein